MAIEGLAKSAGTHAAGVVIADQPLTEYVRCRNCRERKTS